MKTGKLKFHAKTKKLSKWTRSKFLRLVVSNVTNAFEICELMHGLRWSLSSSFQNQERVVDCPEEYLVRATESGCVRGYEYESNGATIERYLGIPYAQPPVGNLSNCTHQVFNTEFRFSINKHCIFNTRCQLRLPAYLMQSWSSDYLICAIPLYAWTAASTLEVAVALLGDSWCSKLLLFPNSDHFNLLFVWLNIESSRAVSYRCMHMTTDK